MTPSDHRSPAPHLSRALGYSVPSDYFVRHQLRLGKRGADKQQQQQQQQQHQQQGDSSEEDSTLRMEVEFTEGSRRRKASIVDATSRVSSRPKAETTKSQCLVHNLVEKTGFGVDEARKSSGANPKNSSAKAHDGEDHYPEVPENADKAASENGDVRATHSRLLTKKQLSDMAMSVRTLAKKLSTLKVKLKIKTIFLLTKAHDKSLIHHTRSVVQWLLSKDRQVEYTVYVEDTMRDSKIFDANGLIKEAPEWESRLKYWDNELARRKPHTFDFVISLGGDGTVLYASWLFQRIVPPVLSFSLGSLGFLTKFDFDQYQETLTKAFTEGITISLRLRFEGTVMRANKDYGNGEDRDIVEEIVGDEAQDRRTHRPERTFEILNDIVVDRGPNPTMSTIELFGDDDHLTTVQADGVCVATPTGSTAYNLAAGGSLCHPENPVILVTAICAHTLSFRPVILPDTLVLRMAVPYNSRAGSWASFDGRERVELQPGDYVTISASRYPFAHVMPAGRRSEDWINSISRTLQWNSRQRQKPFQEWEDENKKPAK